MVGGRPDSHNLFLTTKRDRFMEDIGSIFRNLGKNLGSSDSNEELEA